MSKQTTPLSSLPTITLSVNSCDGVLKTVTLEFRPNETLFEAMQRAQSKRRGIRFAVKGTRASAFITQIDGQRNIRNQLYWMIKVNGKSIDLGCGTYVLRPDDAVSLEFTPFDHRRN